MRSLEANIYTDKDGGYNIDLVDDHGIVKQRADWASSLWGARRCARRCLKREQRRRARGTTFVETIR